MKNLVAAVLFAAAGMTLWSGEPAADASRPTAAVVLWSGSAFAADPPREGSDGTIQLPAFSLPESSFLTPESRAALKAAGDPNKPDLPLLTTHARHRYAVASHPEEIGGVHTEVFVPVDGIEKENRNRVLINVHGGGFMGGWGTISVLESIPIAAVAKVKVISVDYREGPENEFPAASEDVAAVYRQLLKTHKPKNIGLYGCSAGGLLTAEAVAWFQKAGLPSPGAIAMLCAAASYFSEGDSAYLGRAMRSTDPFLYLYLGDSAQNPYFKDTKSGDPLAFPAYSAATIAKFPPSLLISGTRDFALSSVVHTHALLVAQGVDTELHVWEGLGHAFMYDPDLPESREVYSTVSKFFDRWLGR